MGGNTKYKKRMKKVYKNDKDGALRRIKFEIAIGTKVEAMDYLGNWYDARIVKLKPEEKELLIHFDGWNSRFDVWLPYHSEKLRETKPVKSKSGQEWRVGSRVVAKWGPANTIYPAIVSRIVSDLYVEVRFYDGFKKTLKKSSLQPDTEKLYRQYGEGSAIKEIFNPVPLSSSSDKNVSTTNISEETVSEVRVKRRLTEPPGMADYVTDIHKKRRSLRGSDMSTSEDDRTSMHGGSLPSPDGVSSTSSNSWQNVKHSSDQSISNSACECNIEDEEHTVIQTKKDSIDLQKQKTSINTSPAPEEGTVACTKMLSCNLKSSGKRKEEGIQETLSDISLLKTDVDKSLLKTEQVKEVKNHNEPSIPKIKLKISKDSPGRIPETSKANLPKSSPSSKGNRAQSAVEIVRSNFRSYMMFPVVSSPEDSDDNSNSSLYTPSEPKWEIASGSPSLIENTSSLSIDCNIGSKLDQFSHICSDKRSSDKHATEVSRTSSQSFRKKEKEDRLKSYRGKHNEESSRKVCTSETHSKENLFTNIISSKVHENSGETQRRRSSRIDTSTSQLTSDEKPKPDTITTTEVNTNIMNIQDESEDDKPLISFQHTQDDSDDDDQPLIAVKLSKKEKLSANRETSNKLNIKSRKYSKRNVASISSLQTMRKDNKEKEDSNKEVSYIDADTEMVESQQNLSLSMDSKVEKETLRRSVSGKKVKMKSKNEIGGECTSDDGVVKVILVTDYPCSVTRRQSTRIKPPGNSIDKDDSDDSQLKSKNDFSKTNIKLEPTSPCQMSKKSQFIHSEKIANDFEKLDKHLSSNRCLRNRDSKSRIKEGDSQQTSFDKSKETKRDSRKETQEKSDHDLAGNCSSRSIKKTRDKKIVNERLSNTPSHKPRRVSMIDKEVIKGNDENISDKDIVKIKQEVSSPIKLTRKETNIEDESIQSVERSTRTKKPKEKPLECKQDLVDYKLNMIQDTTKVTDEKFKQEKTPVSNKDIPIKSNKENDKRNITTSTESFPTNRPRRRNSTYQQEEETVHVKPNHVSTQSTSPVSIHELRKSSRKKQNPNELKSKDDKEKETSSSKEELGQKCLSETQCTEGRRRSSRVKASPKACEDAADNIKVKTEKASDKIVVQSSSGDTGYTTVSRGKRNLATTKGAKQEVSNKNETKVKELLNGKDQTLKQVTPDCSLDSMSRRSYRLKSLSKTIEDNSEEKMDTSSDKIDIRLSSESTGVTRGKRNHNLVRLKGNKQEEVRQTMNEKDTKNSKQTIPLNVDVKSRLSSKRKESSEMYPNVLENKNIEKKSKNKNDEKTNTEIPVSELNKTCMEISSTNPLCISKDSKDMEYSNNDPVQIDTVHTNLNVDGNQIDRRKIEKLQTMNSDETIIKGKDEDIVDMKPTADVDNSGSLLVKTAEEKSPKNDNSDERFHDTNIIHTGQDTKVSASLEQNKDGEDFQKQKQILDVPSLECENDAGSFDRKKLTEAEAEDMEAALSIAIQDPKKDPDNPVLCNLVSMTQEIQQYTESHAESSVMQRDKVSETESEGVLKKQCTKPSDESGKGTDIHNNKVLDTITASDIDSDIIGIKQAGHKDKCKGMPTSSTNKDDLDLTGLKGSQEVDVYYHENSSHNQELVEGNITTSTTKVKDKKIDTVSKIKEIPIIINIFDQEIPDLNSGRPVRKNKHKKPARYSNEMSDDSYSKSKKETKETHITKSTVSISEKPSTQTTSKSKRNSREIKLKSPSLEKDEIVVPKLKTESKDKKSLGYQEDVSNIKSRRDRQKEKDNENGNEIEYEYTSLKLRRFKEISDKRTTVLRQRRLTREKESKVIIKTESKKIPINKVSKVIKPKISLQTVTGRKHGIVNQKFEEKYEMFKQKWKEEKERRRMLQQESISKSGNTNVHRKTEKMTRIGKVPKDDNIIKKSDVSNVAQKKDICESDAYTSVPNVDTAPQNNKKTCIASDKTFKTVKEHTKKVVDIQVESLPEEKKTEMNVDVVSIDVKNERSVERATPKLRHRIKHTPHSRFGKASSVKSVLNNSKKRGRPTQPKDESTSIEMPVSKDKEAITKSDVVHKDNSCPKEGLEKSSHEVDTVTDSIKESEISTGNIGIPENEKSSITESAISSSECIKKTKVCVSKKGRPKKKRKIDDADYIPDPDNIHKLVRDTSRTPSDTISFASMIEEERPSQKKRPDIGKFSSSHMKKSPTKHPSVSPQKLFQPRFIISSFNHRPFFTFAPRQNPYPTAAQIVASRIQKRVHQQKLMAMLNSPEHPHYKPNIDLCNYQQEDSPQSSSFEEEKEKDITVESNVSLEDDSDDNILVVQPSDHAAAGEGDEIDIMDITLNKASKEETPIKKPMLNKRKSLDFITGRLKYRQKVERQRIDSVVGRLKHNQQVDSQKRKSLVDQFNRNSTKLPISTCINDTENIALSYPNAIIPPPGINTARLPSTNFMTQLSPIGTMMSVPPMQPDMFLNLPMPRRMALPIGTVMSPLNALPPPQPQHILTIQGNPPLLHPQDFNVNNYRPVLRCSPLEHVMQRAVVPFENPTHISGSPLPFQNQAMVPHVSGTHLPFQNPAVDPHVGAMHIPSFPPKTITLEDFASIKGCKDGVPETKTKQEKDTPPVEVTLTEVSNRPSDDMCPTSSTEESPTPFIPENEDDKDDKDATDDPTKKTEDGKKKKKQQKVVPEKENLYTFRREKRIRSPKEMVFAPKKMKIEPEKPEKLLQPPPLKDVPAEPPLNEYKCNITDCGKTFRKSHLLEYHIKYFHTAKPFQKRSRTSTSVSSMESSPVSVATIDTSPKMVISTTSIVEDIKPLATVTSEVELTEQSDSATESESESEDELPSVDDCVKCVCEDECELGFMIQCEQCFTWQHGECVGYSQPKAVPLFYLCHVCSNPKGLRKSSQYDNDYTWYRHGLLPPIRQDAPDDKLDEIEYGRHVDIDNEEVLSSIMLTTHAMVTDLYNVRDVLQGIRNKFILLKDHQNPNLMKWKGENDEDILLSISQRIKEDEETKKDNKHNLLKTEVAKRNKIKKITEKFNEDLNERLFSLNNKNSEQNSLTNKTTTEKLYESNCKGKKVEEVSCGNDENLNVSNTSSTDIDSDVYVVVSSIVQMLCYMVSTNPHETMASTSSGYKNMSTNTHETADSTSLDHKHSSTSTHETADSVSSEYKSTSTNIHKTADSTSFDHKHSSTNTHETADSVSSEYKNTSSNTHKTADSTSLDYKHSSTNTRETAESTEHKEMLKEEPVAVKHETDISTNVFKTNVADNVDSVKNTSVDQESYIKRNSEMIISDVKISEVTESKSMLFDEGLFPRSVTKSPNIQFCNDQNESSSKDVNRVLVIKKGVTAVTDMKSDDTSSSSMQLSVKHNVKHAKSISDNDTDKKLMFITDDVKQIVENIVKTVCGNIDMMKKEVDIDDFVSNNKFIENNDSKDEEGVKETMEKKQKLKEASGKCETIKSVGQDIEKDTTINHLPTTSGTSLDEKTESVLDKDFIDVANISEDSIPYMETDEEFYPTKEKLNRSIESESTLTSCEDEEGPCRQLTCHGIDNILKDAGDWSNSPRESLIACYNVLAEIERIEDQISDRLENMHAKLDELESEYDSIDKSKAILEDFKTNFKLPDLRSLMIQLNKVKWKSIIKSNSEHVPA